ncbi:mechanosensitive ion channel domain-containing protein [Haloarchaeobius sp. TZWSO28]|uniref:mechanosensitive ion channel domain-containing protein n=1 Tax=Haloarchaeobius sp. TZWSO28 TaxID=3446119 RepID=UPI003EB8CEA1
MAGPADFLLDLVQETLTTFQQGVLDAFPRLVMGLVFLTLSYVGIKIVLKLVHSALDALYPEEQDLIVSLGVTVIGVFLWFAAGLALLKILGMGDVAASLGTATGFIALGVSYALSGMIADTVAGVYLLRDPDFNPGYRITTDGFTGEVRSIGLRKSRIQLENGDVVVLANGTVEKKWTREGDETVDAARTN